MAFRKDLSCPHCGKPLRYKLENHYPSYCPAAQPQGAAPPARAPAPPRPAAGPAAPTAPPRPREPDLTPAQAALVQENQGLAGQIAGRFRWSGLEHEELVQQGRLGLVEAARRYDPARGVKFSTAAYRWVEGAVRKMVRELGGALRVASGQTAQKVRAALRTGSADPQAVATRLGVELSYVEAVHALMAPGRNRRAEDLRHTLADPSAEPADLALSRERQLGHLRAGLPLLPLKQQEILRRRFLLPRPEPRAQIGRRLRLSGTRVQQLEKKALARLRRAAPTGEEE